MKCHALLRRFVTDRTPQHEADVAAGLVLAPHQQICIVRRLCAAS